MYLPGSFGNLKYHKLLRPSRFFDAQDAENEYALFFDTFKHHLCNLVQIAFLNGKNIENVFEWPFDIMKHCFIDIIKVAS
jgi:hypothetical protein